MTVLVCHPDDEGAVNEALDRLVARGWVRPFVVTDPDADRGVIDVVADDGG